MKTKLRLFFVVAAIFFPVVIAIAQPTNDDCATPLLLSFGIGSGTPINGTTVGATPSGYTSCGSIGPEKDVYFYFQPLGGTAIIQIHSGACVDMAFEVLSGPCGSSMVLLGC